MKTHQDCLSCGHKGCLTVFDDGGSFCHSCSKTSGNKKNRVIMTDTPEVLTSRKEAFRGISKEVAEFYGITVD